MFQKKNLDLPTRDTALPGRKDPIATSSHHFVSGIPYDEAVPEGMDMIVVALGCFWGAERIFWQMPGVYLTQVGYVGGVTPNPTYEEACSGQTGHTEGVKVVFDPARVALSEVLKLFWESHDPTQGMRQGNDVGTQYRSAIYTVSQAQLDVVVASCRDYSDALGKAGRGDITTEIAPLDVFYPAEAYHQQYLAKNPNGYCGIGGTGVSCPMPGAIG